MRKNQGLLFACCLMFLTQINLPAVSRAEENGLTEVIEEEYIEQGSDSSVDETGDGGGSENDQLNTGRTGGGETGGDTSGESGGDTSGESGGETGGDTSGESGSETGGDTSGESGGETGGDTSGESGGETGGDMSGEDGSETGGDTSGESGGETGGDMSGEDGSETGGDMSGEDGSDGTGGETSGEADSGTSGETNGNNGGKDEVGVNQSAGADAGQEGSGSTAAGGSNTVDGTGSNAAQSTGGGDTTGGDAKENKDNSSAETKNGTGSDPVSGSGTPEKSNDSVSAANSEETVNNVVTGQTGTAVPGEQKIAEAGQQTEDEVEIIEGEKEEEKENPQENPEQNEMEVEVRCDYLAETDSFILTVFVYPGNSDLDLYMTCPDETVKKLDRSDDRWSISVREEGEYVFTAQDMNGTILASRKCKVKKPEVSEEETEETKETEKLQESGQEPAENGSQTPVPDGTTGEDEEEEEDDDDDVEDEVVETLTLDKQNTKKEGSDASSEEKIGTDIDSQDVDKENNALLNAFKKLKSNQSASWNEQNVNQKQTEDLLTKSGVDTGNPDGLPKENEQNQEKSGESIQETSNLVSEGKQTESVTEKKTEGTDSELQQDGDKDELDSDGTDDKHSETNKAPSQSSGPQNVQLKNTSVSLKSLNSTVKKGVSGTDSENEEKPDGNNQQPDEEQIENGQDGAESNHLNSRENGQVVFKASPQKTLSLSTVSEQKLNENNTLSSKEPLGTGQDSKESSVNSGEKDGNSSQNGSPQNENDAGKLKTGNADSALQTLNTSLLSTSLQTNSSPANAQVSGKSDASDTLSVTFAESGNLTDAPTVNFSLEYTNDNQEGDEAKPVAVTEPVYYVQVDDEEPVRLDGTEYRLPQEGDHTLTFLVMDAEGNTLASKKFTVRDGNNVTEENEAPLMTMSLLSAAGTAESGETGAVLETELLSAAAETEILEGTEQTVQYNLSVSRTGEVKEGWSTEAAVFNLSHTAEPAGAETVVYAAQRDGAEPEMLEGSAYTAVDGEYTVQFLLLNEAGDELARSEAYKVKQDTVGPIMLLYITDGYGLVVTGTDTVSGAVSVSVNGGKKWSLLTQQKDGTMRRAYQANGKVTLEAGQICIRDAAGNITKSTERILLGTRDESVELETDEDKMNAKTATTTVKRSSGSGSSRSVSHAKSSTTLISAYNGVDLVLDSSAMSQLMIGEETLDLNLYPGEGNTGEAASFKARFASWNEGGTLDTIVLTADESDENAVTWVFSGTVSKKLSASGIAQMVLQAGDHSITVPTDGFSGGTRYAMYRSSGKVSKDFLYALTMDTADKSFNVNVTVDDETYTLTDNRDSEFYYYDVRNNTAQEMNRLSEEGQS